MATELLRTYPKNANLPNPSEKYSITTKKEEEIQVDHR
jgi:hypothetical protein